MDFHSIARFAQAHRGEDAVRLLLQRDRYPEVDLDLAAQQIEALATAPAKWPSLAACPDVVYPPRLNREQSSSEATARYKAALVDPALGPLADLTGGMGIDTLFFARRGQPTHYCEQDAHLCRLARHNFATLGQDNITVHEGDSIAWLQAQPEGALGTLFIDPARRDSHGGRVTAFDDCTPDIIPLLPLFRSRAKRLLVKASPMLDIQAALRRLGDVAEVHVVAVGGECKELLFLSGEGPTEIVCTNLRPGGQDLHRFSLAEEQAAQCPVAGQPLRYLYEPHAALMKGGCFRLIGQWYGLATLDPNTHLYTSDSPVADFPGRSFEVMAVTAPSAKAVKKFFPEGRAHVMCRNFPLRADRLQKQLHLREGGDLFLIAATLLGKPLALVCRALSSNPE